MTKKTIITINKDIRLVENDVLKCNTEAFPLGIIAMSEIEIAFSDKDIDWNTRNRLRGKLDNLAVKFHTNCSCTHLNIKNKSKNIKTTIKAKIN